MSAGKPYGLIITDEGRSMMAAWTAGRAEPSLDVARIMVGSGIWPDGTDIDELTGITEMLGPVAAATSTKPVYDGDTVRFTVEYRSDMNGGLDNGFWISEYGVYVKNPNDGERDVLFAYCTFSGKPQYVSAYGQGSLDIRQFPVSITIGQGAVINVMYDTAAFMNAQDVAEYVDGAVLPKLTVDIRKFIKEHDADDSAHPAIQARLTELAGRLGRLEDMYFSDVTGNPFLITFENLNGLDVQGVWNKERAGIEF